MQKLINCKACGNEVAKGSKCPSCGKDSRNFFMKHKVLTGILVILLIGGVGSASSEGGSVEGDSSQVSSNENKSYNVSDVVELKGLNFVVNKVYTVEGDEFTKPKDGNEYIAIDCTVENTSNEEKAISSIMMFKVVDSDGRACDYSLMGLTAAKAGQLDGNVGAGRKMSGVYVVEVPKGTKGLEMEFSASLISGNQVVVKLN
ncbi:MAG: DUF4352 domain-containing protein [Clostridium sp.]